MKSANFGAFFRKYWLFLAVLAGVCALGLSVADSFIGFIIGGLSFYALAISGLLLLAGWFLFSGNKRSLIPLKTLLRVWFCGVLFVLVFVESSDIGSNWRKQSIHRFAERTSVSLDKIKEKNGSYPAKLPQNLQQSMPGGLQYSSSGENYGFQYSEGLDISGYDGKTHSWWSD